MIPTCKIFLIVENARKEAGMGYAWLEAQGLINGAPEWEDYDEADFMDGECMVAHPCW